MIEGKPQIPGITDIKGSKKYYEVKTREMNLFATAYPAYHYIVNRFLIKNNPEFQQPNPDQLCVLGGFFPDVANITATHALAREVGIPLE